MDIISQNHQLLKQYGKSNNNDNDNGSSNQRALDDQLLFIQKELERQQVRIKDVYIEVIHSIPSHCGYISIINDSNHNDSNTFTFVIALNIDHC